MYSLLDCAQSLRHVPLFVTAWSVARQAPLSMGFPGTNTGVGCHIYIKYNYMWYINIYNVTLCICIWINQSLPRWLSGKESTCNVGDSGSIAGSERSPEEEDGNTLQYSCLENPMDREEPRLQSMWLQRVRQDWMTKQQQNIVYKHIIYNIFKQYI